MKTTEISTKYGIRTGDKFYEGDTEWTFLSETDEGLRFKADVGYVHIFEEHELSALARIKGSERSAF